MVDLKTLSIPELVMLLKKNAILYGHLDTTNQCPRFTTETYAIVEILERELLSRFQK